MNKKIVVHYIALSTVTLAAIVGFVFLFQTNHALFSRAQDVSLTMKIKLQGEHYPQAVTKATVVLYSQQGKTLEFSDVVFSYQADKTFQGTVSFDPLFNYNIIYAIYIKPSNYFGKLFCTNSITGKDCGAPQFIFRQDTNIIDLSAQSFFGGDIPPVNGKVDAYDMSKIMANLGTGTDSSTDINNDGITNTIDYVIALYSLSNNIMDDPITITFVPLTPTLSPTITTVPTTTPSATLIPTTTVPSPTTAPTLTPTPTIAPPTSTPRPTATPAPTATPVPVAPRCHVTPDAPNTPFYLNVGGRTACGCSPSGLGCGHLVCSSCPSGVCECPQPGGAGDAGCSNGGTITAVVDSIFGGCP